MFCLLYATMGLARSIYSLSCKMLHIISSKELNLPFMVTCFAICRMIVHHGLICSSSHWRELSKHFNYGETELVARAHKNRFQTACFKLQS